MGLPGTRMPLAIESAHMPEWFPPLAAASLTVLLLNIALWAQRARNPTDWSARFLRDLRRWDGRLPEKVESSD
jgi:hypothetical protein